MALTAVLSVIVFSGSGSRASAQKAELTPHQTIRWPESDRWVGRAAAFVLDDRAVAVRGNKHVQILNVAAGRFGHECMSEGDGFNSTYVDFRWLPEDEQLVCWSREAIDVWDLGARRRRSHVKLKPRNGLLTSDSEPVLTPDGKRLVGETVGDTLEIFDVHSGNPARVFQFSGHRRPLGFSHDGKQFLCASGEVIVMSVESGAVLHKQDYEGRNSPHKAQFLRGAAEVLGIFSGGLVVWNLSTGRFDEPFSYHHSNKENHVTDFVLSEDEQLLITASSDKKGRVWHFPTRRLLAELIGHENEVSSVALSADEEKVTTLSWDRTIRLWDISALRENAPTRRGPAETSP